jgi:protein TonB
MKRAFILSVLLHAAFLSSMVLFIKYEKTEIKRDVFYADLVRPEVGQEDKKSGTKALPKAQGLPKRPGLLPKVQSQAPPKAHAPEVETDLKNVQTLREYKGPEVGVTKKQERPVEGPPAEPLRQAPIPPVEGGRQGLPERKTFREKFFDRDVIKEVAKAVRPLPEKDGSITFDTKEFRYHGYLKRLRERIEGVWKYPQEAAERGIYGDLYLRFTIKKNGRLGDIELVRTSGYKLLDDAAIRALREADPFWPLPDELGKEAFTITGHFVYSIYGVYLR